MRVVIYARYSSNNQRQEPFGDQPRELKKYAAYNDIQISAYVKIRVDSRMIFYSYFTHNLPNLD